MARFKPGQSGNPKGRPKGARDKVKREMQMRVQALVDRLEDYLEEDLQALEPSERVKTYVQLLEYVTPKLQRTDATVSAEVKVPRIVWSDETQDGD